MEIGNNLKKLRAEKGMTQKDLADELCVSSQAVSRWENNEVEPDISTLSKLSSIFGVSVDAIITGNFEKKENNSAEVEAEAAAVASAIGAVSAEKAQSKRKIKCYCYDCHNAIYEDDEIKVLNRKFPDGHVETHEICADCYNKRVNKPESTSSTGGVPSERKIVAHCTGCGKALYEGDKFNTISKPTTTHKVRGHTHTSPGYTRHYCPECDKLREKGKLDSSTGARLPKYGKKRLVFGIIFGIATLVASMIIFFTCTNMSAAAAIFLPIGLGYGVFATIYCLFTDCYIGELFVDIASFSIKMPGIIFTFDLDGLAFLIVMKILFAIIGVFIGIAVLGFAIAVSMALSIVTFPFVVGREAI